jgi:RNA polymerase sigma-70 factor (ECF subfamily)
MDDDASVIQRVLRGEKEAFRTLIERYQEPLFRFLRNLCPDGHDCEDLAQEVFVAAFRHLPAYDSRRAGFRTWLLSMARNRGLNWLRQKKHPLPCNLPEECDTRTPEAQVAEREFFVELDAALAALPFEQKTAFILSEIEQLPLNEIADIEGVKVGTIKSRVSRAKEKLRSLLARVVEQQP